MDPSATKADFDRHLAELRCILLLMRAETRENYRAVGSSKETILAARDCLRACQGPV